MIMENTADKILVGTPVIDRPETTAMFFDFFLEHSDLSKFYWVVVDNNSNEETKEVLRRYRKYYQVLIENPFNTGVAFSINQCLTHRLPGQHYLNTNVDSWIMTHGWLDTMMHFVDKPWTGIVSGRRPALWTDPSDPERLEFYRKNVIIKEIDNFIVELPKDNSMVFPWCLIKGTVLDQLGFMDEDLNVDDVDFTKRVLALNLVNVYIPDVCILQYHTESQRHPEYRAYRELVAKAVPIIMETKYGPPIRYRGTRFLPETITDDDYRAASERNYNFFEHYQEIVRERKSRRDNMKITKQVEEKIARGEKIKLDLGSGYHREEGFVALDRSEKCEPDILCDLEIDGIPLPDSCVEEIRAIHILEHCADTIFLINEIWRVCTPGAKVYIVTPHTSSDNSWVDPTHKRSFSERSCSYWDKRSGHYNTPNAGADYGVKAMFRELRVTAEVDDEVAAMSAEEQRFAVKFFRNAVRNLIVEAVIEK